MSQDIIIVTGAILAQPDTFDELQRISLAHVHRSRTEPGCLSHGVAVDSDNPLRLVFHEEWADETALLTHFAVPESRTFAAEAARLAAEKPAIAIWRSAPSPLMTRF